MNDLADKLLVVAHRLHIEAYDSLRFELLTVEVWKAFPSSFGLHEFSDRYPDSHRVALEIEDLVARGWLRRVGSVREYALTTRGRHQAEQVMAESP